MGVRTMDDLRWERKLNIITGAAGYEKEDNNHSRYEPTSYAVLERLAQSGWVKRGDVVVDYGCGKGRVSFLLNYLLDCRTVGVEYNEALCTQAQNNLAAYTSRGKSSGSISFVCTSAENYHPDTANCFYFFNPFSVKILRSVLGRIYESYYENPREMKLFFYYALDGYLDCLMSESMLGYEGEIDCRDLFHNDDVRERILVFRIGTENDF